MFVHEICSFHLIENRHQKCTLVYEAYSRTLQLIRNKNVPTQPNTTSDIKEAFAKRDLFKRYCMTEHEDGSEIFFDRLYSDPDGAFEYCIFSSKKIIKYIKKTSEPSERRYLMDATFQVVPYGSFSQLLIIHAEKFGTVSIHSLCKQNIFEILFTFFSSLSPSFSPFLERFFHSFMC